LKYYDTQSSPTAGAAVIRDALSSGAEVVTGFNVSATLTPSVSVLRAANKPWVTSGAIFAGVDTIPFFFSLGPSNQNAGKILVRAAKQVLGDLKGKTVALAATSPSVPNDEKVSAAKAALKAEGAKALPIIRDPNNFSSWSSQAANVMAANADAIISFNAEGGTTTIAKALNVAGFRGPILSDVTANSDTVFNAISATNFYAVRDFNAFGAGSPLFNAVLAAKASTTRALASASLFSREYVGMFAIAQTLEKCGVPCSTTKFMSTLKGLGKIKVPNDPFFSPLDFSKSNAGETFGQIWKWDAKAKKAVPGGPVINL
jgi:ABC-type branched-subunit amino acid transport system substrate-binding protein